MAETDWPQGFWGGGNWADIEQSMELFAPVVSGWLGTKGNYPRKYADPKDRYKTEAYKVAHRKAAREYARRKRAEKRKAG
jgi:hypothetical protein